MPVHDLRAFKSMSAAITINRMEPEKDRVYTRDMNFGRTDGMNALISVIVPVYKVEKYLHKCVDSILNQTYKNLEIILVDDGSPDSCPQICDAYAEKDSRIKVIHTTNGGVSNARNKALDIVEERKKFIINTNKNYK